MKRDARTDRFSAATHAAERLATYGAESLGDVELLAIATGGKLPEMVAAHEQHGGVGGLSRATVAELAPALGRKRAAAVVAAFELARRAALCDLAYASTVRGPEDVARQARALFGDLPQECFAVIGLDTRQRVRLVQRVALGSVGQVDVHPREVFRPLVRAGMHACVLVHNHPSGEPDPSDSDIELTRRLADVGRTMGIPVLDHVIVTRTRSFSLAALGVLAPRRPRLLDLGCSQGGASRGYVDAGFDVVGVDLVAQPRYPFAFVQADAFAFVREHGRGFDAVHASMPCQRYSQCNNWRRGERREAYPDLVGPMRETLDALGVPYALENVVGSPLRADCMLCGTGFGLLVMRHRIFESSVPLGLAPPCNHWSWVGEADPWRVRKGDTTQGKLDRRKGAFVSPSGNPNREKGSVAEWLAAMETPWMDRRGVTQAIPPAFTRWIGGHLLAAIGGA